MGECRACWTRRRDFPISPTSVWPMPVWTKVRIAYAALVHEARQAAGALIHRARSGKAHATLPSLDDGYYSFRGSPYGPLHAPVAHRIIEVTFMTFPTTTRFRRLLLLQALVPVVLLTAACGSDGTKP